MGWGRGHKISRDFGQRVIAALGKGWRGKEALDGPDRLSPGRGLFLKQTRPSTDRRLVSAPAARA